MTKHPAPSPHGGSEGASLADLIQLECLSGSREAVLVTSSGRQGHLFFEGGALVDARTSELAGDDAAFEIIGWKTGTFGASDLPWPSRHTVTLPWRELLLQAVPGYDQFDRTGSERVVAMNTTLRSSIPDSPASSSPSPAASGRRPSAPARARQPSGTLPVMRRPPALPPAPSAPASLAGAVGAVRRAVRLDDSDSVIAVRGDADDLAAIAPALKRAVAELGDLLGLQAFRAFECTFGGRQLMHYRDTAHSTITLEAAPGANLEAVRSASKH